MLKKNDKHKYPEFLNYKKNTVISVSHNDYITYIKCLTECLVHSECLPNGSYYYNQDEE